MAFRELLIQEAFFIKMLLSSGDPGKQREAMLRLNTLVERIYKNLEVRDDGDHGMMKAVILLLQANKSLRDGDQHAACGFLENVSSALARPGSNT